MLKLSKLFCFNTVVKLLMPALTMTLLSFAVTPVMAQQNDGAKPIVMEEVVKIGVLVPRTGAHAGEGGWLLKGHKQAEADINAAGGLKGFGGAKVQLVVGDTQSKPEASRSEAERLIEREKVSILIGGFGSGATIPAAQVANRNKVPFIVLNAVTDNITEQGMKYVFRLNPKSKWYADDVSGFLKYLKGKGHEVGRVAIAYEDGPFGQATAKSYRAMLADNGFNLVAEESFRTGTPDLSIQVAKLKASNADVVLTICYVSESIVLVRALAAQQFRPIIIGFGGGHLAPALLKVGEPAEGSFAVSEWMPDLKKPAALAFATAFAKMHGESPQNNSAQVYAGTWMAALAVEAAKSTDREAVRNALTKLKVNSGPASLLPDDVLEFDLDGQNKIGNVIAQMIDGRFVTVWPETFAAQPFKAPKK